MGKTSRDRKHSEKMKKKRAEKAARKAQYLSLAGTSKKTKNQKKKSMLVSGNKHAHLMSECGNPGCKKCHPNLNKMACLSKSERADKGT